MSAKPIRHRPAHRARADWHPTIRLLIKAAEIECPPGHAEALTELLTLALHKVPVRGIFDPGTRDEPEWFQAIEEVAKAHFEFGEARKAYWDALAAADLPFDRRDLIERNGLAAENISGTVYFYTGLAFGLAFFSLAVPR